MAPVCFLLTLRLLVAVVQNYICGVVHSSCQVLNRAFAKLIHSEDVVVDVGDAVDVVLKDIDAEGVMEHCAETERTCCGSFTDRVHAKIHTFLRRPPASNCNCPD